MEEQGTVTLNPDRPLVGTALTASLTDPDGGVTGETWQWSRSDAADGTFTGIGGATRASYTPVEADEGMYLKITVTYTDGHGPGQDGDGFCHGAAALEQSSQVLRNCAHPQHRRKLGGGKPPLALR